MKCEIWSYNVALNYKRLEPKKKSSIILSNYLSSTIFALRLTSLQALNKPEEREGAHNRELPAPPVVLILYHTAPQGFPGAKLDFALVCEPIIVWVMKITGSPPINTFIIFWLFYFTYTL